MKTFSPWVGVGKAGIPEGRGNSGFRCASGALTPVGGDLNWLWG